MTVSIVIPAYNEAEHIAANLEKIYACVREIPIVWEFVVVDDGSADETFEAVKGARLPSLRAIRLSRNFGKESALSAGLAEATGDACIVMDSDLQHPPELIPEMLRLWAQEKYEVVEAVKENRGKESTAHRAAARLFYRIFDRASGLELENASDFKLLDRKVVEAWKTMTEHATFFRGMSSWVGFRRVQIPFSVQDRAGGETKWNFGRLCKLAVNAVTSFSALPLQLVTGAGVLFLIVAVILGIETLVMKILGHAFTGFTTVILLLLIIGSLLMLSLGVIGTYIAKIYDEVKARPRYLVAERIITERGEE